MLYYAFMATAGSVAGCYVIYYLANKGGEAFVRKRLKPGHVERSLALYQRHGLLALMVPALLPPPAPFKLFVLAAGLANVRPLQFVLAIAVARGSRYLALGILAIYYGDAALELMRTHGRTVALVLVGLIVAGRVLSVAPNPEHRRSPARRSPRSRVPESRAPCTLVADVPPQPARSPRRPRRRRKRSPTSI